MHKQALKLVYSSVSYWIISGAVFACLLIVLLAAREFLFFEPFLIFHLPTEWIPHFVLIIAVAGLIGLVTSLAIYQIRIIKQNARKTGAGIVGSIIGIGAGVCTSCGPVGFSVITTFGVAGVTTLSFLYDYEIPIRLVAIGILVGTYFLMIRGISKECKINNL